MVNFDLDIQVAYGFQFVICNVPLFDQIAFKEIISSPVIDNDAYARQIVLIIATYNIGVVPEKEYTVGVAIL